MELAPLLVVVPRVVRAHAEAVPHRQRRLVPRYDRARGVLRALRAILVLEEEQVALARRELEVVARENRRAALGGRLAVDERRRDALAFCSSSTVGVRLVPAMASSRAVQSHHHAIDATLRTRTHTQTRPCSGGN